MQKFDLFGSIVGITYKGQSRYKSPFGGASFIIAVLLCLTTIIFFFQKFLNKDNPKMVFEEEKFWNPPVIDLTDFKFIIMMKYNGENVFKDDVIKVKPLLTRVEQKQGNQTEIELKQIPCEEAMFPGAEEQFESLELGKGICVDTTNISIQGGLVNDIFQYLTIRFMLCLDESEGCINKLNEYIDNVQPYALVYMYDSAFQPFNPEKFTNHYFDSFEVDITFDYTKYSDIYLSNNKY
jgi:hypothetical protein